MAKLRQEITLNNAVLTASGSNRKLLQSTAYNDATFFFEVVGRVASGTMTVSLRRFGTTTDDATLSFTETSYTRKRTASFTPPTADTEYFVFISGGTSPQVNAARIVINQDAAEILSTSTVIEIGNTETGKTNTASAPLNNPKYWKYESAKWDAGFTYGAEVVWRGNNNMQTTTITIQEDNGSFGSWTTKATIVNAVTGTLSVLRARVSFTPVDGRHYRIASVNSSNMTTYDIFSACIIGTKIVGWAQVGNSLSISGVNTPALAALSSTRVAFIDGANDQLRTYDFDGTNWSQTGNSLSIATVDSPALAKLSSSRVAFIDFTNDQLRTYDFDGTNWSQTGNSLSIANVGLPALAGLSGTRVAFIDGVNDQLRTYDFDGTDWAQAGNSLSISGVGIPALAALSATRVAFIDGANDQLRTYDFDGTNWSQTGNSLSIANVAGSALAALSGTRVAFIDDTNDQLRTYDFDGTNWSQGTGALTISGTGAPALAGLLSNRIAFIDATNDQLRTYDFDLLGIANAQPQMLLANTGSFGGATGLKDYDTRYDPAEWDVEGGTIAFYHEGNGVSAGTGDLKLQSDPNGTPADVTGSQITDCIEVERSSALTMPGSATDIDVNVTGTGTLNASRIIVDWEWDDSVFVPFPRRKAFFYL